jgi:hypothetical protein
MKEKIKKFEELDEEKFEKSRDVFVESVRNISNVIYLIEISKLITSKKLFDLSILTDEKDLNIKN